MKKLIIITTIACLFTGLTFAQSTEEPELEKTQFQAKTIFKDNKGSGFYGGLEFLGTSIGDNWNYGTGIRLAWLANHNFGIGIAGFGLIDGTTYRNFNEFGDDGKLEMGWGGLLFEPVIAAESPVHIAIPVIIGFGGATLRDVGESDYFDYDYYDPYFIESDGFVFIEPGVEVEVNLLKFMCLAVGARYRLTDQVDIGPLKDDDLSGLSTNVTLKFGKF